jgi:Flp pilus assembly protein TadD
VKGWGYDEETNKKVEALKPKADAAIENKQWAEALPLWEQMETLRPMDQQPHSRLAALYLKLNKPDAAVKELETLNAVELHDNRYAKAIARILRDEGKLKGAVEYAKKSVYIDPYDSSAHELLAEVYEKSDNQPGLSKERRVIAMLKEWKQMQAKPAQGDEQPSGEAPASQPLV